MVKIVFAGLVIVHGLIHLLGFVNQWNVKKINQFTGVTLFSVPESLSKILGIAWLIAALLFVVTAIGFIADKNWWSILGIIAIIISQLLIIIYWKDAYAGTIANVIILVIAVVSFAMSNFNDKVNSEISELYSKPFKEEKTIVTKESIKELPPVVQKWMKRSGIIGKENINCVRLKQKAVMRSKPDAKWMDVEAEQYFRLDEPAFIYKINVDVMPMIKMTGRDKYVNGEGNMLIKISGLYTIGDSKGAEINQGTMIRFLSETFWFPSFALSKYVSWKQIDGNTAMATMNFNGAGENVLITFTPEGDVKKIEAERFGEFDGKFSKEKWVIVNTAYKEFEGIRISSESEVTWQLQSGDFTWLKLEITGLEYNKPEIYK